MPQEAFSGSPTIGGARETLVLGAVVSLVDGLLGDLDVVEVLTQLTEQCVALLDVTSAGLLLADASGRLHLMAATSQQTRDLELFQLQSDDGPCLDCYSTGKPVMIADLTVAQERWPQFAAAATDAGFRSVHAVPMRAAGKVLGALGLFGTVAGGLGHADQLLAQTLAHVACVAILHDDDLPSGLLDQRLGAALASRVVVEQAKGFIRSRLGLSVHDAFAALRAYARGSNEHLTAVSRRLIVDPDSRSVIETAIRRATYSVPVTQC